MKPEIKKNNSGISILEVIVAMTIITIGLVGVLSLVIQNVRAYYVNRYVLMAAGLAQEGLELVRNVRDLNWLTQGNAWKQGLVGDSDYTIDYNGATSIKMSVNSIADAGLYINGNGFYTHDPDGNTLTNFYRLITVIDRGGYLDIKCTVRWKEGTQNHDYTAETYLYNWR